MILTVALVSASFAVYALAFPFETLNTVPLAISSSCSTNGPQSCHNTSAVSDSDLCCFEAPGGLLLQTQFWDTNPSTGPSDSWTVHGLWPDRCDLTFASSCDPSRAYTGIPSLLTNNAASSTLAFMNTFWVDINGQNEQFWEHEWAKHGTSHSAQVACQVGVRRGQKYEIYFTPNNGQRINILVQAVAYFKTVEKLFKSLPTYTWLANAGITPSSTKTYTLATLLSALKSASGGFNPALDCTSGSLNAISWYFNLRGSAVDGVFVPINAPQSGSCPSSGIKYPLKNNTPTTTATGPTGTSTGLPSKATIRALQSGSFVGGLLSKGTWSTQTLATYTISGSVSSFTMTSSQGICGVSSGTFSCGSGVTSTSFSAVLSGSNLLLASSGTTTFTSTGKPSGTTVFPVFVGSAQSQDYSLVITGS